MEKIEYYINGLVDMAASVSSKIGRSYIRAISLDKKKYLKEFAESIKYKDDIVLKEVEDKKLIDILNDWLGDEHLLATNLNYYITSSIGEEKKIYKPKDEKLIEKLSCRSWGYFYFYEDIYFVEFKDYMICFMVGNNE